MNAWRDFKGGKWQDRIDVRDFIQKNYTPYDGRRKLPLQPPTAAHRKNARKSTRTLLPRRSSKTAAF